jgi:hypothetical protein
MKDGKSSAQKEAETKVWMYGLGALSPLREDRSCHYSD